MFSCNESNPTKADNNNDPYVYQIVEIGNQLWMAENLKVTHYRNGDAIPNVTDNSTWGGLNTGAYCAYNNDYGNVSTYGLLYNWYAVDDSRNIAPEGWHVASDEEWKELEIFLGMSQSDADTTGDRGTDEGAKLKEADTTHWNSPNTDATNSSGFTALLGGYRNNIDGFFHGMGYSGIWCSSTESEYYSRDCWGRNLVYWNSQVSRYIHDKKVGFSVRCIKD